MEINEVLQKKKSKIIVKQQETNTIDTDQETSDDKDLNEGLLKRKRNSSSQNEFIHSHESTSFATSSQTVDLKISKLNLVWCFSFVLFRLYHD
jgi:hypothetical protein